MVKLSAVVITYNEEKNIDRCLKSLKAVADDIVVVDSFSTDKTGEICLQNGARFVENVFEGHIEQKNFAITQAKYSFILSVDADEVLSPELIKSILKIKKDKDADGYSMNRLTNYCGKWIRFGGWNPDIKLRLWDSSMGKWGGVNPHDCFEMEKDAKIKRLKGRLLHYSYYSITDHIKQVNHFTDIAANEYYNRKKEAGIFRVIFASKFKFIRDFILKCGFLDGYYGFVIARISSHAVFLKYAKLRQLNNRQLTDE